MKYINTTATRNDIVYTPCELSKKVVYHYKPSGKILDPSAGEFSFFNHFKEFTDSKNCYWCEIGLGKDFFKHRKHMDWCISNTPFSKFRPFLKHAMKIADNIAFVAPVNHFFTKARLRDIKDNGFYIKEILFLETPKNFPSSGFALAATHLTKGQESNSIFNYTLNPNLL